MYNNVQEKFFVSFPGDSSGWLFYILSAKKPDISLGSFFDGKFTSPLHMSALPFKGASRIMSAGSHALNIDTLTEKTDSPNGTEENF